MSRSQKDPVTFRKKIFRWYEQHARKLLWRNSRDPYKIWVSEVMLQQTTVQAVLPYYQEWMKTFPDIESLSQASSRKVLKTWQGLGYYQRARNLHQASKIIVDKHQGRIPQDYEEMRKLPGFGPYITAAVLSIAFNKPFPVMEANIRRVLMRITGARGEANPQNDQKFLRFLKPYFPQNKAAAFNQALMELGALVCRPKNPSCLVCPLSDFCQAFKDGEQEVIPRPKKREYRKIDAVVAVVEKNGRFLIQKRPPKGLLADLWEFPGGKRKTGETLEEALRREIREELQSEVLDVKLLIKVSHAYTQYQVSLYAFQCRLAKDPSPSKKRHRWVTLHGLRNYPFPSGSAKIIKFLEQRAKAKKRI